MISKFGTFGEHFEVLSPLVITLQSVTGCLCFCTPNSFWYKLLDVAQSFMPVETTLNFQEKRPHA